ncbi:MAG: methyl-accepting chemotaxis protein [Deltaproteobacteria bacterium]|jgi:methyl-accepting chemotaxis protein|nr:methyl-accepting chemotaxis protein [Deltaproteobacteria bacterium]
MSIKAKIMIVVSFLVVVAIAICAMSFWVILKQSKSMDERLALFDHMRDVLTLNLGIEEQAVSIRDVVLADDTGEKINVKARMDEAYKKTIAPLLSSVKPASQEDADIWQRFLGSWAEHHKLMESVYQNSLKNTGYIARLESVRYNTRYWLDYQHLLRGIFDLSRPHFDDPKQVDLALTSFDTIEAVKSLLMYEKLALLAETAEERDRYLQLSRTDMARITKNLNFLERALTNPKVTDQELASFNATFREASAGKVTFFDNGEISWASTKFTLPPNFINPDYPEQSKIFWESIKPLRGGGTEILNHIMELAAEDTNSAAYQLLTTDGMAMREKERAWIEQIVASSHETLGQGLAAMADSFRRWTVALAIVTGVGLIAAICFAASFVGKLGRTLFKLDNDLNNRSNSVQKLANQLTHTASELANGAVNSSASLQQTSATLEELSTMTTKNANNSQEADALMKTASESVLMAQSSMDNVISAMKGISDSGNEIGKIIKSIDEIAFQTNLLALNAAVEAARAGEAGSGFAVVAEEVRNLAIRSADAAKNTAKLIETTIANINAGSKMVNDTAHSFLVVTDNSQKVANLIGEVAEASKEQSLGITQISKAMGEIDRITQINAASAQQSAEIAQTLNDEEEKLRETIEDINTLVSGHADFEISGFSDDDDSGVSLEAITRREREALPAS